MLVRAFGEVPDGYVDESVDEFAGTVLLFMVGISLLPWMSSSGKMEPGYLFLLGFVRPIKTTVLVALPMIYIASMAVLFYLVPAALLRVLFGIPFPLVPMAALVATISICGVGAVWSFLSGTGRGLSLCVLLGAIVLGLGLPGGLSSDPGWSLTMPADEWAEGFAFSAFTYAAMVLLCVVVVTVTTFAIDGQRHGEALEFKGVFRFLKVPLRVPHPRVASPLRTAARAQLWLETRRAVIPIFLVGTVGAILAFFCISWIYVYDNKRLESANELWMLTLIGVPWLCALALAFLLSGFKRKQGTVWLSSFDATQAAGTDQLVAMKLFVLSATVLVSWLPMAGSAVAWAAVWGVLPDWIEGNRDLWQSLGALSLPDWVGAATLAGVLCLSCGALLLAGAWWQADHPFIPWVGATVVVGHAVLALLDSVFGWVFMPLWITYAWLVPAALIVVAVLALRRALSQGFLTKPYFMAILCAWLVSVVMAVGLYLTGVPENLTVPVHALVLAAGVTTLPLSSFAGATLALASHRHR